MTDPGPITCRELVELVTDYVEDALPAAQRARFEEHLGRCDWCSAYVVQYRETVRVVERIDPEGVDARVEEGFLDAFRRWRAEDRQ